MFEKETILQFIYEYGRPTHEMCRLMQGSKRFSHPVVDQVKILCSHKHYMTPKAFEMQSGELQEKLWKIIDRFPSGVESDNITGVNAMWALVSLAKAENDFEKALEHIELIKKKYIRTITKFKVLSNYYLLSLYIQRASLHIALKNTEEVGENIRKAREIYQDLTKLNHQDLDRIEQYCDRRDLPPFDLFIKAKQIQFFRISHEYHRLQDDYEPFLEYALRALNCELINNLRFPIAWIKCVIDLIPICLRLRAFSQSYYLLRAANEELHELKSDPYTLEHENLSVHVCVEEGRLFLAWSQHCVALMFDGHDVEVINEKIDSFQELTADEKKCLDKNFYHKEFEHLIVPDGNEVFDQNLEHDDDIRYVYDMAHRFLKSSAKKLTIDNRVKFGYDRVLEDLGTIEKFWPFVLHSPLVSYSDAYSQSMQDVD